VVQKCLIGALLFETNSMMLCELLQPTPCLEAVRAVEAVEDVNSMPMS